MYHVYFLLHCFRDEVFLFIVFLLQTLFASLAFGQFMAVFEDIGMITHVHVLEA